MSRRRLFIIAVLLCILIMAGMLTAAAFQENTIRYGQTVSDSVGEGASQRWTFEGGRGDVVEIRLRSRSEGFTPQVSLLDSDGILQARTTADEDGDALTLRLPEFDRYTLEITGQDEAGGAYTLRLSLLEAGTPGFEQGDLVFGERVNQRLTDETPYHIWTFEGSAGQVVDVRMRVTSGDLQPTLTLISPLNETLGLISGADEANLLALRLPNDGQYRVIARREGNPLGLSGQSQGVYRLELTLRNGADATPNSLIIGQSTGGQLTEASPLARYAVVTPGNYIAEIELSTPGCLIDLTVMLRGLEPVLQVRAQSPLAYPFSLTTAAEHIIEISSANCLLTRPVDFTFSLNPVALPQPLAYLPPFEEVFGNSPQVWFFEGQAGEIVRFRGRTDAPATFRLLSPGNLSLYSQPIDIPFETTLILEETGYYGVAIEGEPGAYRLQREILGRDGVLFSARTPLIEEVLDITTPQSWRLTLNTDQDALLLLQDPSGQYIALGEDTAQHPPRINRVYLSQIGRYRIHVFGDNPSGAILRELLPSYPVQVGQPIKSTLTAPLETHRWPLTAEGGALLNLRLTRLTGDAVLPSLALLDASGVALPIPSQRIEGNTLVWYGLTIPQTGRYTLQVTNNTAASNLTYEIISEDQRGLRPVASAPLLLPAPIPAGVQPTDSLPYRQDDRLAPAFSAGSASLFENAPLLSLPESIQGEIPAEQVRQVWEIRVVRGQLLAITATSVEDDPAPGITLFDENLNILTEVWERDDYSARLLYRTPIASTYYIGITGDSDGTRYLMTVETLPEIDESVATVRDVTPLQIGQPIAGEFSARSEVDVYAFQGVLGDTVSIAAMYEVGDFAPQIRLLSPSGVVLNEEAYNPDRSTAETGRLRLNESGIYTLEVSALPLDEREAVYGRYQVLVGQIDGQPRDGGLLAGEVLGSIGFANNQDVWLFRGRAGETVTLTAEPYNTDGPTPLILALADSEGVDFYRDTTYLSANRVQLQDVMLPRDGLYQVRVSGGVSATGNYRLRLTRDDRYLQGVNLPVTYGDTVSGLFTPGNILDRWVVAGNRGDVIAVALRPARGDNAFVGFQVENASGQLLATGIDRGTGGGARVEGITLPETGVYSIYVSVPDPAFAGNLVYDLSVERQNRTNARSIGDLLPYGVPVTGGIYADDTQDVWLFEGDAGDLININLSGDGLLVPTFSLIAPDAPATEGQIQTLLARTGTSTTAAGLVNFELPASGTYALTVNGVNGSTGIYQLTVDASYRALTSPRTLTDQTLEGNLGQGEAQTWVFDGLTGEIINLALNPVRRSTLAPELTLIAPDGTLLIRRYAAVGEVIAVSRYTLPMSGRYQVVVNPVLNDTRGRYTLSLSRAAAVPLPAPRLTTYIDGALGELDAENLADQWAFEGAAGDIVQIAGRRTSGSLDVVLTVTAPDGSLMSIADDTAGIDAAVILTLPQDGVYQVDVARFGGARGVTSGNYRLDLNRLYQPGTSPISSNPYLAYGEGRVEVLETGETDLWYFAGLRGDVVDITLQYPTAGQRLFLTLSDGAGNPYALGLRTGDTVRIEDFTLPADGVYHLLVNRSEENAPDVFYPYHLRLSLDGSAPESLQAGGFIGDGVSANAGFAFGQPTHVWFYPGVAGENFALTYVRLAGETNPEIAIYAPGGSLLSHVTPADTTFTLNLTLPVEGLYQIVVVNQAADPLLTYRLVAGLGEASQIAGGLAYGVMSEGMLPAGIAEESWLFEGRAGQAFFLRAESESGEDLLSVQLLDSLGGTLAIGQYNPVSRQTVIQNITLPADGEYRVTISKAIDTPVSYRLRVSDEDTLPASLGATPLISGAAINGFVDGASTQRYILRGQPNTPLSLQIDLIEGTDTPAMTLYNEHGEQIAVLTSPVENLFVPQADDYLLELTSPSPVAYTLTYSQPLDLPDTEIRTTRRDVNQPGGLSPATPYNLWAIEAEAGETLIFELDTSRSTPRLNLLLSTPDSLPMRTFVGAAGADEVVFGPVFIPITGTYILRVGSWLNQLNSQNGSDESPYVLRVREVSDDGLGSEGGALPLLGQPVYGGLNGQDTRDSWTFSAYQPGIFALHAERLSGEGGLTLQLENPDGSAVDLTPYLTESAARIQIEGLPLAGLGIYTLHISSPDEGLSIYRLTVTETASHTALSLNDARLLQIGDTVQVADGAASWVFFGEAGETVTLRAESDAPLPLQLFQGDTLILTGESPLSPVLLPASGLYRVQIGSEGATLPPFTLSLTYTSLSDTLPRPFTLGTPSRARLDGSIPYQDWQPMDYSPGLYTVVVRPDSLDWQPQLYLLDANGGIQQVGEVQPGGITRLTAYLDAANAALFRVSSGGVSGSYSILFDVASNINSPAFIQPGVPMTGRLNESDEVDEWLFNGQEGQRLSFRAEQQAGEARLSLRLFAPGNLFLSESTFDASGVSQQADILLPISGTYIIQVVRLSGEGELALYSLEMTLTP